MRKVKAVVDLAVLELIANLAKCNEKTALEIDRSIKLSAWKSIRKSSS